MKLVFILILCIFIVSLTLIITNNNRRLRVEHFNDKNGGSKTFKFLTQVKAL